MVSSGVGDSRGTCDMGWTRLTPTAVSRGSTRPIHVRAYLGYEASTSTS
jgi:hypothetical protein